MKNLVKYFIKYPVSGNLLMGLILIFGVLGMLNMRSTFFPQAPIRNIMVQAVYPGASPEEIEESVVLKIEDQLTGVTGVERVTSTSRENSGTINVEIKQRADVELVLQDVKNAVDQITSFPVGLEELEVYKLEIISQAVSFSLTGSENLYRLKEVSRRIERDLLAIDGISKVEISGFPEEEIAINFDEAKLQGYGLNMQQVLEKVAASNIEVTGGAIKTAKEEYKIRLDNKAYRANELRAIPILATPDGRSLQLKDVATVEDRWADNPDRNFLNGAPAVTVDVKYTNDEDLLSIAAKVKAYIKEFNEGSSEVKATIIQDQSKVVNQRIDMLVDNGVIGFVIVLLLLAMFLHYRLALWVAFSIPIAFGGMFILASFFGITINVISLFGMITVIGILVDDGVVISENIYRHHEMGKGRIRAAIDGTMEVAPAVFSAILTTVIVFSTFFFIDGRLGDFFGEMAFIVIATLIFSLVEGLFILPAHVAHSKALDRNAKPNRVMRLFTSLMEWLRDRLYKPLLNFSLSYPAAAVAIPFFLLAITIGSMGGGVIQSTFFPPIERDDFQVDLVLPSGTREAQTLDYLGRVEKSIWDINADFKEKDAQHRDLILNVDKRIGPGDPAKGVLRVELLSSEERTEKQLEIIGRIRDTLQPLPGVEQLIFGSGSPFGKPISIALIGEDITTIRKAAEELKFAIESLADAKDVSDSDLKGIKEVKLKLKPKAYPLGYNEGQVISQVRRAYFGGEVQRIQRGLDEVRVWVRYSDQNRSSIQQLREMEVSSATGNIAKLGDIVDLSIDRGVIGINHISGKPQITVEADIASDKVSSAELIASIQKDILPPLLERYPSLSYSMEGQYREQQKSMKSMMSVVPVILILMLAVIVLTFRSFTQTLIVFLLVPFALIGVAWGHYLHGMQISLFSWLGMIALIGILINDSLVFVSAFNTNIKEGQDFNSALKDAALSRFRPILLTSITTIAGLAPLILEKSFQAQFLIPMALTIAYGLAVATFIILVVLPALLKINNRFWVFWYWWWHDKEVEKREVEPAFLELKSENHE